jgi:N-acetylglucosamine malate deacetylase 1
MKLKNKKIMIISPHLDDEIIGCGGLIDKAFRDKAELFIFYITSGKARNIDNNKVDGETKHETRVSELKKISDKWNFKWEILYTEDSIFLKLDTLPQRELIDKIEDKIYSIKPDILLLPFKDSYNQDHRAVFTAAIAALRPIPAKIRQFVPMVLMYDEPYTWSVGDIFKPNIYLDISGFEENKAKMMSYYASQDRQDPFPRSGNNLVRMTRIRGAEIGVMAAEAYTLLRGVIN